MKGRKSGFTIFEVLFGTVFLALIIGPMISIVLGLHSVTQKKVLRLPNSEFAFDSIEGGGSYSIGSDFSSIAASYDFHFVFAEMVDESIGRYLYGGASSVDGDWDKIASLPLSLTRCPNVRITQLQPSATGFFDAYLDGVGVKYERGGRRGDFTLLLVGDVAGDLAITALVQVRSVLTQHDGHEYVVWQTRLVRSGGRVFGYDCAIRSEVYDELIVSPGGMHTWYRFDALNDVFDEGISMLSFPDPGIADTGGGRTQSESLVTSKYMYTLSVSN